MDEQVEGAGADERLEMRFELAKLCHSAGLWEKALEQLAAVQAEVHDCPRDCPSRQLATTATWPSHADLSSNNSHVAFTRRPLLHTHARAPLHILSRLSDEHRSTWCRWGRIRWF